MSKKIKSSVLRLSGQYIAFIGDSFCAHISNEDHDRFRSARHDMTFRCKHEIAYPSLVAKELKLNIAPYGYGGRSWWWSWQRFLGDWAQDLHRIEAMIFTHTSPNRINNAIDPALPHVVIGPGRDQRDLYSPNMRIDALETYVRYILDEDFQIWAQRQFFKHLRDVLPPVKILHFFATHQPSDSTCEILPGRVFRTPLALLSLEETEEGRIPLPDNDRANHFNEHNNRAMARLICQHVSDYHAGCCDIPWQEFYQFDPERMLKKLSTWDYRI